MKKTPSIILTLLISLSISISSAQNSFDPDHYCPTDTICKNIDTLYCDCELPDITYNYYFKTRFIDKIFRFCFPHKYKKLVFGPGHVVRTPIYSCSNIIKHHHHSGSTHFLNFNHACHSTKRGGFGHFGSGHSQSN
jgi:hypothetical protein